MTEETGLRIRTFGAAELRRKAAPVKEITPRHRQILSEMARLMYEGSGIGLAGPQVGIGESLIVVDIGYGLYKIINPVIVKRQGRQAIEEGCLSIPGICIKVKRSNSVTVTGLDEEGSPLKIEAEELLACVLQHEIDHLSGRLIIDYASVLDKLKIRKILAQLKKQPREELPESKTKSCRLQL